MVELLNLTTWKQFLKIVNDHKASFLCYNSGNWLLNILKV
jgi:hypothetical protein